MHGYGSGWRHDAAVSALSLIGRIGCIVALASSGACTLVVGTSFGARAERFVLQFRASDGDVLACKNA